MQIEIDRKIKDFPLCRDGMTGKLCMVLALFFLYISYWVKIAFCVIFFTSKCFTTISKEVACFCGFALWNVHICIHILPIFIPKYPNTFLWCVRVSYTRIEACAAFYVSLLFEQFILYYYTINRFVYIENIIIILFVTNLFIY